jgi:hypothetical protein
MCGKDAIAVNPANGSVEGIIDLSSQKNGQKIQQPKF